MSKVVGIDLGTSNSCVAVKIGNQTIVIPNSEGGRTTPSCVAFDESGRTIGRAAKGQAAINPTRTLSSVKRLIGLRRSDVASEEKMFPYKIVGEPAEMAQIEVDGKRYFPQEISAMVLADLKRSAEAYLGEPVTKAVVTVPAYFSSQRREATIDAGRICGLEILRIINEPTASALAYGLDKKISEKIFCCDVGGGTADFTVLQTGDNVFEVLSTAGDERLGGDDIDFALTNYVAEEFLKSSGFDIRKDPLANQRLVEACEKAKCDLSSAMQAIINLPYITSISGSPKHLSQSITRAKFESICSHVFERVREPIIKALSDAKLAPNQIDQVVLVGGSMRTPRLQEILKEIFGGKELHKGVNLDEVVAIGAAIQASVLAGETHDIVLLDVTPLSLGVETMGGLSTILIKRNTTIPTSHSEVFSTASDNQPAVDVHVVQGEHRLVSGNRTIGKFQFSGIPPQPRGQPQIEIQFSIDANGIVSVTAKDKNTGKEQKVTIEAKSGLEKSDIERMIQDAKANEAEENEKADLIESRNTADALVYSIEKFIKENAVNITVPTKASVTTACEALKKVLSTNATKGDMEAGNESLESASKAMYAEVFGAATRSGQAAPVSAKPATSMPKPPTPPPPGEIEGQFRVL